MTDIEPFERAQLQNEIGNDHKTALRAEKAAKRLSKQALMMVGRGINSALAYRSFAEKLGYSPYRHKNYDPVSVELATNAALRKDKISIGLTPGIEDEWGTNPDTLKIKSIDGQEITTE